MKHNQSNHDLCEQTVLQCDDERLSETYDKPDDARSLYGPLSDAYDRREKLPDEIKDTVERASYSLRLKCMKSSLPLIEAECSEEEFVACLKGIYFFEKYSGDIQNKGYQRSIKPIGDVLWSKWISSSASAFHSPCHVNAIGAVYHGLECSSVEGWKDNFGRAAYLLWLTTRYNQEEYRLLNNKMLIYFYLELSLNQWKDIYKAVVDSYKED